MDYKIECDVMLENSFNSEFISAFYRTPAVVPGYISPVFLEIFKGAAIGLATRVLKEHIIDRWYNGESIFIASRSYREQKYIDYAMYGIIGWLSFDLILISPGIYRYLVGY